MGTCACVCRFTPAHNEHGGHAPEYGRALTQQTQTQAFGFKYVLERTFANYFGENSEATNCFLTELYVLFKLPGEIPTCINDPEIINLLSQYADQDTVFAIIREVSNKGLSN